MIRINKIFFLLTLLLISSASVFAEGVRELYSDQGLYYSNAVKLDLQIWNDQYCSQSADVTDTTACPGGAPEGGKCLKVTPRGCNWTGWALINSSSTDYSEYAVPTNDEQIRFWLNSTATVQWRIMCNGWPGGSSGSIWFGTVPSGTGGKWQEIIFPLGAYRALHGLNLKTVTASIEFLTNADTTYYVDHIRWMKPMTRVLVFPPQSQANVGQHRQMTMEGRSVADEFIPVYATFTVTNGSVTPVPPASSMGALITVPASGQSTLTTTSILRAYDHSSTGLAVSGAWITGSASNQVVANDLTNTYALYSETISSSSVLGGPFQDANLSTFSAYGSLNISELTGSAMEGNAYLRTTLTTNDAAKSYAGWTIVWGSTSIPAQVADTYTKDMSNFYDGSLRFWFRGQPALAATMTVGVRSGNVSAGGEISKVNLSSYVTFDSQWHPVVIPLSVFAKPRPWADLSRMKCLVTFSANGLFAGSWFDVDNIRWDTKMPGALNRIVVTPDPIDVPVTTHRIFKAHGYDVNGSTIDIIPQWTMPNGSLGTLTASGNQVLLDAAATAVTGTLQASSNTISGVSHVTVKVINFTQAFNVFSDNGNAGPIMVSTGPSNGNSSVNLSTLSVNPFNGTTTYMHALYTLGSSSGNKDAWAGWFVHEGLPSRYMGPYSSGYLHFFVRTNQDLQISIRSANVNANTNHAKITLQEFGIPRDGSWQEVYLPLSEFQSRESTLDFNQITDYFIITALASASGDLTNQTFDVGNVQWLTTATNVASSDLVLVGLQLKQQPSGLVRSFDGQNRAVTYDQALSALAYTFRGYSSSSKKIFDVYKGLYNGGTFDGFSNEYDVTTPSTILNAERAAGPNAFMLLSLLHYRSVTADTGYDGMIQGIAVWLKSLQDTDGAIRYGKNTTVPTGTKSTEHNFDTYAAFVGYSKLFNQPSYQTSADQIKSWLLTVYNPAQKRFNLGEFSDGSLDTRRALDVYSLAPLSVSSFSVVLQTAKTDLGTTQTSVITSLPVKGFDFYIAPTDVPQAPDSVWYEGTAQMALAYKVSKDTMTAGIYLDEMGKGLMVLHDAAQGDYQAFAYASNPGSGFGGTMDAMSPSASSMAWFIFASDNFNPLHSVQIFSATVKNISDDSDFAPQEVQWVDALPQTNWNLATHYVQLEAQPMVRNQAYGVQIYTDNTNPANGTTFVDTTPTISTDTNSDPAGVLAHSDRTGSLILSTTTLKIPFAWTIRDQKGPVVLSNPSTGTATTNLQEYYKWFYVKDLHTPDISLLNTTKFSNGDDYVTLQNTNGYHFAQGGPTVWVPLFGSSFIYFEGDFSSAAAQTVYKSLISIEYYTE